MTMPDETPIMIFAAACGARSGPTSSAAMTYASEQ